MNRMKGYSIDNQTVEADMQTLDISGKPIRVFRLADGTYRYCPTSIASAIGRCRADYMNYLKVCPDQKAEGNPLVTVGKTRVRPLKATEVRAWLSYRYHTGLETVVPILEADLERLAIEVFSQLDQPGDQPVRPDLVEKYRNSRQYFLDRIKANPSWARTPEAAKERQKLNKVLYRVLTKEERQLLGA